MFAKPFKVKSNNSLKNSEKKHLIQRIVDEFPAATEEVAKDLVPMKSSCSCMKLTLHSGEVVEVFVVNGAPMLLATAERLLPTVAALWRAPNLLPALTVHTPVLSKIQGGAPLYLPGVVVPAGGVGWPVFARGAPLQLRTQDNAAAAAVGRAQLSSGDMLLKIGGVCMEVLHWTGDQLCRDPKFGKQERPLHLPAPAPVPSPALQSTDKLVEQLSQMHVAQEWPALGGVRSAPAPPAHVTTPPAPAATPTSVAPPPAPAAPAPVDVDTTTEVDPADSESETDGIPQDMDGLLVWSLLTFLKLQARSVELPLLSSLLYRNYLLPLCPPTRTLDVKKSSYKKVGKFLHAMQQEGFLQVREVDAGVVAVTALNTAHVRVRSHAARAQPPPIQHAPPADDDDELEYSPPLVREMFSVTAAVADLLQLKKGTTLTAAELRNILTEYVKTKQLTAPQQKGAVVLDAALAKALQAQEQECMKWDALMAGVQSKLTACTEMRFADGTHKLTKAKLDPVRMQVVNRSGNKKVTLVSNLEAFGFSLAALARLCQRGVAASCGVTRAPGAKHDQLMLQGDQTYYVARLLIEKYGLPKKFVEGADKALKKKKGS